MSKRLYKFLINQDVLGTPIGVHYKGQDSFKTGLGALCTLATYVLILVNSAQLLIAFENGSE